jgi:hypothetical protein
VQVRVAAVSAAALLLALGATGTAAARPARHSKAAAERHILATPRFFRRHGRLAHAFIDPKTRLFKTNVTVKCRARSHRRVAHVFRCTVRYGNTRMRVRYVAVRPHRFRLSTVKRRR